MPIVGIRRRGSPADNWPGRSDGAAPTDGVSPAGPQLDASPMGIKVEDLAFRPGSSVTVGIWPATGGDNTGHDRNVALLHTPRASGTVRGNERR